MMMSTLLDSNILLDVLNTQGTYTNWSKRQMARLLEAGPLVINQIIYSETSCYFTDIADFETTLHLSGLARENYPWQAAFIAGKAHAAYRKSGGTRDRTLPDFLIGGHAAFKGYSLLTRDPRRYRAYFNNIDIIAPDTHP